MLYANVGGIRDSEKQEIAIEFCKSQNKDICILAETHIGNEQIHKIKNNWLGPVLISPGDTFSKGLLILLHPGFPDVTEIDSDPNGRFISFKIAPSGDRVLCVYAPSGHSNREQLTRKRFFEKLSNYIDHKFEGNENKIILGDLNCTLNPMDRDERNKTQKRYRCHSNFALSKLILDQGLEDLWRRKNPDTSEFTRYDRTSGTRSRIARVYTDIKIANNTKINHKMISFSDHYNALLIERLSSKTKTGKDLWLFNNTLLQNKDFVSSISNLLSSLKRKQGNFSSVSDWWEYTKIKIKLPEDFPKILPLRKTLEYPDSKRDCETCIKRKILNLK